MKDQYTNNGVNRSGGLPEDIPLCYFLKNSNLNETEITVNSEFNKILNTSIINQDEKIASTKNYKSPKVVFKRRKQRIYRKTHFTVKRQKKLKMLQFKPTIPITSNIKFEPPKSTLSKTIKAVKKTGHDKILNNKDKLLLEHPDLSKSKICIFCDQEFDGKEGFGEIISKDGINIHYFCLLFSSGLDQRGPEDGDFGGFLLADILKEYKRAQKLKCVYCKRTGATIGCNVKACRKTYHFPCSLKLEALNQYFGSFSSYCSEHRQKYPLFKPGENINSPLSQRLTSKKYGPHNLKHCTDDISPITSNNKYYMNGECLKTPYRITSVNGSKTFSTNTKGNAATKSRSPATLSTSGAFDEDVEIQRIVSKPNILCLICREEFETTTMREYHVLRSECCEKAFLHRDCIQKQAFHSGYLFQCPNCCNKDIFNKSMLEMGIYIPERDASWELEANAFKELYVRPNECSALDCRCPNGKTYSKDLTIWEIVFCKGCGHLVRHLACAGIMLTFDTHTWYCEDCLPVYGSRSSRGPSTSNLSVRNNKNSRLKFKKILKAGKQPKTTKPRIKIKPAKRIKSKLDEDYLIEDSIQQEIFQESVNSASSSEKLIPANGFNEMLIGDKLDNDPTCGMHEVHDLVVQVIDEKSQCSNLKDHKTSSSTMLRSGDKNELVQICDYPMVKEKLMKLDNIENVFDKQDSAIINELTTHEPEILFKKLENASYNEDLHYDNGSNESIFDCKNIAFHDVNCLSIKSI